MENAPTLTDAIGALALLASAAPALFAAVVQAVLGVIPAAIAADKGRPWFLWWLYAALFLPFAWVHAAVLQSTDEAQARKPGWTRCPDCLAAVPEAAQVCRHCGHPLAHEAAA